MANTNLIRISKLNKDILTNIVKKNYISNHPEVDIDSVTFDNLITYLLKKDLGIFFDSICSHTKERWKKQN